MGNQFCFKYYHNYTHQLVILKETYQKCEIILTGGNPQYEYVQCSVIPITINNFKLSEEQKNSMNSKQCVFLNQKINKKYRILMNIDENQYVLASQSKMQSRQPSEEKHCIFTSIREAIQLANDNGMESLGFPVIQMFDSKYCSLVMLLGIKSALDECQLNSLKQIVITLDHINQVTQFKYLFRQFFQQQNIKSTTANSQYHSSLSDSLYYNNEQNNSIISIEQS